jgi:ATP-dependent DNA helicase UvrD/PcrA
VPSASSALTLPWVEGLDSFQRQAVLADEGVVQIIAPAGSGKTRVLVSRVKELISRGVAADKILCAAFNSDTREELKKRLADPGVAVHTFHSLGWHILDKETLLADAVEAPSQGLLRKLAREAKQAVGDGAWVDPQTAVEAISHFKLIDMIEPREAMGRARASGSVERLTVATLYELYEQTLDDAGKMDFDDLIVEPIRLFGRDPDKRRAWQARWTHVLVDEYQDIEPAQELLIQLVAAPQDCLFAVGDEDQCLYAWRRASVGRVVELDQSYPGVERHALETNYRCPGDVVRRSRLIIEHNEQRFPKTINAARPDENAITVTQFETMATAATATADNAKTGRWRRNDAVILARTTRLLRGCAIALARAGVTFDGPDSIFKTVGALRTVEAYLCLLSNPQAASEEDVEEVFRVPNRYLPSGQCTAQVTTALRAGKTFVTAVAGLNVEDWRQERLNKDAPLLDSLGKETGAKRLIQRLRAEGGVDSYYAEHEQLTPTEQVDIEMLDVLEQWADKRSAADAASVISRQSQMLRNHRDPDGVELATIHGAKGREWPVVVVFGFDDSQLPHYRSLESAATEDAFVQAIEDERRLAYVAFTRTTGKLHVIYAEQPSRFLVEAELAKPPQPAVVGRDRVQPPAALTPRPAKPARTSRTKPGTPRASQAGGEVKGLIAKLRSTSIDERRVAASSLGFHPTRAAAEALKGALSDRDARVRQKAASSLGRIGTEDALPALRKLLEQESKEFIRYSARIAVGQIKKRTLSE